MDKKSKVFIILVILSALFCFLYNAGHTYMINGDGTGENAWKQGANGEYILNSFSPGLNKGKYSLSIQCQNDTGKVINYAVWDMEHNDGNNHLGTVVAKGSIKPGNEEINVPFVLEKDSYQLQLSAQQAVNIGNWSVELVKDSYTDGIFFFLLIVCFLYIICYKVNWKKPQYCMILGAIAIFITIPFAGEILNAGHDLSFHLSRIRGVAEALSSGQFPVRVNVDMNQGYGFLSEILYPNLFVYFPAVLTLLGLSVMSAYKYWILAINIATALVGYYSFSRLLKSNKLGLFCGILYLINPYRLNNIFLRASIGELLAEIFLPLLVYALAEMIYGDYKKWKLLAVSTIGILQSHVLSLEICILFAVIFCVISWRCFVTGKGGKRIIGCIKAALIVIVLNMWFLIPFLDQFRKSFYLLADNRALWQETVQLQQMFQSFFHVSGESIPNGMEGEMPLTIGVALLLGSVCYLYYAYGAGKIQGRLRKIGSMSLFFGALSCYMASDYFPWKFLHDNLTPVSDFIGKIQYPFRMLGFASLFLCIVTAIAMGCLFEDGKHILNYGILFVSALIMLECMDGYIMDGKALLNSRNQDAFLTVNLDYYGYNIAYSDAWIFTDIGETIVTDKNISITGFEKHGTDIRFHFARSNTSKPASMRMPLYNYELHKAYMNGKELPTQTGDYGMITIDIPKGVSKGNVLVVYAGRKLYRMGDIISLAAILILLALWLRQKVIAKT